MMRKSQDIYIQEMENNIQKKELNIRDNYEKINLYNKEKNFFQIEDEELFPYKIDIEPTTRCFLKCRYCQVPYWERNKLADLSFETLKKIVDSMPYLLEMKLQGQGEPLLNKELFKMVEYATNKNILVRFNTNGMLLNGENRKRIIESGLFELRISMDGATAHTNNLMRQGLDFNRVINNISLLVKERGGQQKPLINIWMLLTKNNIDELDSMIDLCAAMGVDGLKIQTKLSTRDDIDIEKRVLADTVVVTNSKIQKIISEAYEKANKAGIEIEIITNKWRTKENPCWWLWNSAYISSDGYVVPCSIINNPNNLNFGNVKDKNFYDIWLSEQYKKFRKDTLNMKICKFCEWCYINEIK